MAEQETPAAGPDDSGQPAASAPRTVGRRLADALARRGDPLRERAAAGLRELDAVDQAVFAAVAATPTSSLDVPLRRLSDAANNSVLWLVIAAGLGAVGGPAGRRAAVRGTAAIAVTSPLVNLVAKSAWSRQRPDRAGTGVPAGRNVRMPGSASFPSGHAAAGFAFATAVGRDQPWLGMALRFLAAAVAYSRVHAGVHYPGDVVIGSLVGASTGQAVGGVADRLMSRRRLAARRHPGGEPGRLGHGAVGRVEQAGL
jgi:undecaprenyl-diphosphatase